MPDIRVHREVSAALADGRPVVALESAVVTTGLPRVPIDPPPPDAAPGWRDGAPANLETARLLQRCVREAGATPATVAILDGDLLVGVNDEQLERLALDEHAGKAASGDVAPLMHARVSAGTTVSATLLACTLARPAPICVFATGGIGGVHRNWSRRPDISTDLWQLARSPVAVVSAGAKSMLDLAATLELLQTLAVPVLGYRTDAFPRFYAGGDPDLPVPQRVDCIDDAAAVCRLHLHGLALEGGLLLVQPPPTSFALDADEVQRLADAAEDEAGRAGVTGPARTPFVLARMAEASGGRTLHTNVALLAANARLAGALATAMARPVSR